MDCPICLEPLDKPYKLSCDHSFHSACLKQMNKLQCPLCRTPITKISSTIQRSIIENEKRYREEQIQEEHESLLAMFERRNSYIDFEIARAIQYLQHLGMDMFTIDEDILIDYQSNQTDSGYIFNRTIEVMLEYLVRHKNDPSTGTTIRIHPTFS